MTAGRSTAASRMPAKCARCAATEGPRESTRGITMRPAAPVCFAWAASDAARAGFCAPVPTTTGTPAFNQGLDALLPVLVGEERPVAHRAAIDHGRHADPDQLVAFPCERLEIRRAVGLAGGHQGGNAPRNGLAAKGSLLLLKGARTIGGGWRVGQRPARARQPPSWPSAVRRPRRRTFVRWLGGRDSMKTRLA